MAGVVEHDDDPVAASDRRLPRHHRHRLTRASSIPSGAGSIATSAGSGAAAVVVGSIRPPAADRIPWVGARGVRLHVGAEGVSWGLGAGRWSWNAKSRQHTVDTPGPGYWQSRGQHPHR